MREHHPDRNPGDKDAANRFKEIQEAYEVLGDKARRQQFDQFGFAGGPGGGMPGGGPMPGGGFQSSGGGFDPNMLAEMLRRGGMGGGGGGIDLGEIFGGMGGRPGGRRRAPPPAEVESEVTIPFVTAAIGGKLGLHVDGREIDLTVPAGVEEGKKLRLKGQGPGGADLIVKLHVAPHPYFRREGNNVVLEVPLALTEAVLGTRVDVPTLDGTRLTVKVPPGTSTRQPTAFARQGCRGGRPVHPGQDRHARAGERPQPRTHRGVRESDSAAEPAARPAVGARRVTCRHDRGSSPAAHTYRGEHVPGVRLSAP